MNLTFINVVLWICTEYVLKNVSENMSSVVNKGTVNADKCLVLTLSTRLCLMLTVLCPEM